MKDLVLLIGYLAVVTSTCENPMLTPEGMESEQDCGSGLETEVTSTMAELVPTTTPVEASMSVTPVTDTPPKDSPSSSIFTSGLVVIAAGCGAGSLALVTVIILIILIFCRRRLKKCRNGCPCVGRSKRFDSPIIKVTFRTSLHGDRASYYIQTDELGPTSFYTHSRMDFEPSEECDTEEDEEDPNMKEVHFKNEEISDGELHVKELDNLEKVLDSALVKFESTTL